MGYDICAYAVAVRMAQGEAYRLQGRRAGGVEKKSAGCHQIQASASFASSRLEIGKAGCKRATVKLHGCVAVNTLIIAVSRCNAGKKQLTEDWFKVADSVNKVRDRYLKLSRCQACRQARF